MLETILAAVREHGLPDATSSSAYRRERRKVASQATPFGPLLQRITLETSDGPQYIWVQNPMAWIEAVAASSDGFRRFMLDVIERSCRNLTFAVYNDEVDAGRELAARHGKKFEVVYWTVLECGPLARHNEMFWFTLVALRSDIREKVDGGMSHVMKLVLDKFYGEGHDWRTGVLLLGQLVFGQLRLMNQDERAHKGLSCCFGAGGKMFCILCQNVHDHKMRAPESALPMVPSTCLDATRFVPHTDATLRRLLVGLRDTLRKENWRAIPRGRQPRA